MLTCRCLKWLEGGLGGDAGLGPCILKENTQGQRTGERCRWLRRVAYVSTRVAGKGSRYNLLPFPFPSICLLGLVSKSEHRGCAVVHTAGTQTGVNLQRMQARVLSEGGTMSRGLPVSHKWELLRVLSLSKRGGAF